MNTKYFQEVINKILCDIKTLKETSIKKIKIFFGGGLVTPDLSSINFTGNVLVSSDSNGNTIVNIVDVEIPSETVTTIEEIENGFVYTNEEGVEKEIIFPPQEDLGFDGDRVITRNVLGLLGQNLGTQGVIDTLEELLYPYLAPTITLSAPSNSVFEKQTGDTNINVTGTSVKNTDDITSFKFFLNNVEIYNETSVNPNGQTVIYVNTTVNTDNTINTPVLQTFKATISDGTTNVDSNTRVRTLVYPFYNGVQVAGASNVVIQALTKSVVVKGDRTHTFSPSNQKIYFAYPSTYGVLNQIDDGALNVTNAFTLRTDSFTMLDGQVVQYNIYESNNLLTTTNYTLNFKF